MTIEEIRTKRRDAELQIIALINGLEDETGMSVSEIYMDDGVELTVMDERIRTRRNVVLTLTVPND